MASTPVPATPTVVVTATVAAPPSSATTATPEATATVQPAATATPRPEPTLRPPPTAAAEVRYFWVQVLAVARRAAVEQAQERIEQAGFPRDNQRVVESKVAGGGRLYKLRIGPFPDRDSANRVAQRMRGAGFPDAWIVQP
jgi:cell division septation protein DedD